MSKVGFARVLSDKVTLAYLADVFILPDHQSKGLGKRLVAAVLEHEDFSDVQWLLVKHKMPRSYTRNTALDSWQLPTDLWCGTQGRALSGAGPNFWPKLLGRADKAE